MYVLTSQTRRAATSIPANIAEEHGRSTTKDFVHFIRIAYASACELDTHFEIAERLGYLTTHEAGVAKERTEELNVCWRV